MCHRERKGSKDRVFKRSMWVVQNPEGSTVSWHTGKQRRPCFSVPSYYERRRARILQLASEQRPSKVWNSCLTRIQIEFIKKPFTPSKIWPCSVQAVFQGGGRNTHARSHTHDTGKIWPSLFPNEGWREKYIIRFLCLFFTNNLGHEKTTHSSWLLFS